MATLFWQQNSSGLDFTHPYDPKEKSWNFSKKLHEQPPLFFKELVKHHQMLNLDYSIHCTKLAKDLLHQSPLAVSSQIEEALMMAETLEHIYRNYLDVPTEVIRLRRDQAIYRQMLASQPYQFSLDDEPLSSVSSPTKTLRGLTATINFPRILMARIRRLLITIGPVAKTYENYQHLIGQVDPYVAPMFTYAAWLCFTPRALTNLFLMGKHLIPGSWMSPKEKSLGLPVRFQAQISRRWFELGNDIPWMILGLLSCFMLTGTLATVGFYASLALFAYDVGLAAIRSHIELDRLKQLKAEYTRMKATLDPTSADYQQLNDLLAQVQKRMDYEGKRQFALVANTVVLLVAFAMAFPLFAAVPIVPLIGAGLAVLATLACYFRLKALEKQKPSDKVSYSPPESSSRRSLGFFPTKEEEAPDNHHDIMIGPNYISGG